MQRVANPKVLGFIGLASAGWVYSLASAGWVPGEALAGPVGNQAAVVAMLAMFIAGILSFARGEAWYGGFFLFWSALWWSLHATHNSMGTAPGALDAWYNAALAAGSLIFWLGALRRGLPTPVMLVSLGVTLVLLGFALAGWLAPVFRMIAGYVGMASALLAFWAAWTELGTADADGATATTGG